MPIWIPVAITLATVCLAAARESDASPRTVRAFVRSAGLPPELADAHLAARLGARASAVARGGGAVLAAGTAAAAGAGLLDGAALSRAPLVALPLLALAVPVAIEILGGLLVRAPRPAGSARRLAQDDALRAQSLRALYRTGATLGAALGVAVAAAAMPAVRGGWPDDPMHGVVNAAFLACGALTVGCAAPAAFGMPGGRFRRRLWPHGATGPA